MSHRSIQSGSFEEEEKSLVALGIEPRFLGRRIRDLVTIQTTDIIHTTLTCT